MLKMKNCQILFMPLFLFYWNKQKTEKLGNT